MYVQYFIPRSEKVDGRRNFDVRGFFFTIGCIICMYWDIEGIIVIAELRSNSRRMVISALIKVIKSRARTFMGFGIGLVIICLEL